MMQSGADSAVQERALDVLCGPALEPLVEMVLSSPAPDVYEARAVDGMVRFGRRPESGSWVYDVDHVQGRDPLARQDASWLSPLDVELARPQPDRAANSYPWAYERIAQLWDHPAAPDLCVLHTAAHRWEVHRGEHGSLDVVQSRAPLVLSGAGVRRAGMFPGHARLVDVAPTVLALLGATPGIGTGPTGAALDGALLRRQDGRPLTEHLDGATAEHVVVVLFDGANANVLYRAVSDGHLPHVATLLDDGMALEHGAVASLPTVTLANHTTLHTGCHPGHHGVLHNAWFDRSLGRQVVTESPSTWQEAMQWLAPGVETVHEAIHRHRPGAVTVSVNEPADRGADYSTFDLFRDGELHRLRELVPEPLPHAHTRLMESSDKYRWGSVVDASGLEQARAIWNGGLFGRSYPPPTFTWVSFSLTDAAMHEGGPHSEMAHAALVDSDARLGVLLDAVERRGVAERTAVLLVADHGMEHNDAERTGDWNMPLRQAGITHRDEAAGFLYLGERPDADAGQRPEAATAGATPDPSGARPR
jgi:phosphonoacetate hydrolase